MSRMNLDDYETVDTRLHRFWEQHRETGAIDTDLIEVVRDDAGSPRQYVVKATVIINGQPVATGYAEEIVGSSPVNRTSALENAETSAIGRALANYGYSTKGSRPSREEMQKATKATTSDEAVIAELTDAISAADNLDTLRKMWAQTASAHKNGIVTDEDRDHLNALVTARKALIEAGAA